MARSFVRLRTVVFRVLSILIAGGLIWITLRKTNWAEFAEVLQTANYNWLILLIPVTLLSHLARAWRWRLLLDTLSSKPRTRPPLGDLFAAVMIGYMINFAIPRAGELVRAAHLAQRQQVSTSGVLGTVVSERLIDIVFLAIGLVGSALYFGRRAGDIWEQLIATTQGFIDIWPWIELVAVAGAFVLVPAVCWRFSIVRLLRRRIRPILVAFTDGLATGLRTKHPVLMWTSTLAIWLLYGVMAYLPLIMFDLTSAHGINYVDGLCIMFIGAVGALVPTPGGAGSYHYITVLALVTGFSMARDPATAYAVFVHGYQLLLYLATGLLMIVWKGGVSKVQSQSEN